MNHLAPLNLPNLPAQYRGMLERIEAAMPEIRAGADNFHKSASQFKVATLDVTPLTPLRTMKQILAECERTRQALEEAHIKVQKNKIEIRRREHKLLNGADAFDKEVASIEITELQWQNANIEDSMRGAVRKLAYLAGQYQQLLAAHRSRTGRDLTEEDYEREEVRYQIMTAFKQAWIAANARGGQIDEGNLIYLFDLGIPLSAACAEIGARYHLERELLKQGKVATHEDLLAWLAALADKFSDCPAAFAKARGLTLLDATALSTAAE